MAVSRSMHQFTAHKEPVSACRFLNNDSLVATASNDSTIALWVSINWVL